jgi:hypothetical protein
LRDVKDPTLNVMCICVIVYNKARWSTVANEGYLLSRQSAQDASASGNFKYKTNSLSVPPLLVRLRRYLNIHWKPDSVITQSISLKVKHAAEQDTQSRYTNWLQCQLHYPTISFLVKQYFVRTGYWICSALGQIRILCLLEIELQLFGDSEHSLGFRDVHCPEF